MARGLYRRRKLGKSGKLRDTGAYIIDIKIKQVPELKGIKPPRIAKTTGVFPGDRNAETVVSEMKQMVKELIRERDAGTLRKIHSNALSLPSAYKKWKTGRIHLAEGHEDKRVVKSWRLYLERAPLASKTSKNRLAIISGLVAKKLLSEQTLVSELPDALKSIRRYYEGKKQAPAYNQIRIEMRAFLTKGLNMEPDAALVRELLRVKPLKEQARREHHPFYTPQECRDFIRRVLKRPTPQASLYAQSILFMCQHGLRPEEFEGGHFLVDEETGHLRIEGTKTPNAKRIVPILSFVEPDSLPKFATLNRLFERMGAPVRCRDFRRTYSIWCQRAQIPQNHVSAYMGHAAETVTQTYQGVVPKHMILDEDRSKLLTWYEYELAKANTVRKKPVPMTQVRALQKALKPSPADLEAAIAAMVADADEFPTD